MIKVIINADDCGRNPKINKAIDKALSLGIISSTTILANTQYMDEVKEMIVSYPNASFGIHLNLTEGKAFTHPQVFKELGIVDDNNCFVSGNSKRCVNPNERLKEAIKEEWDAQLYHLIIEEKLLISHVDGHHHCHTWPGLEMVLYELMLKYGLSKARNRYHYPPAGIIDYLLSGITFFFSIIGISSINIPHIKDRLDSKILYDNYNRTLHNNNIMSTDYFGAYETFVTTKRLPKCKSGVVELMCHPGIDMFANEYKLINEDALNILNNNRIKLISYKEL